MSDLLILDDARLRPTQPGEGRGMRQVAGVFDRDGARVALAEMRARIGALTLPGAAPGGDLPRRTGRWLYGGIAYGHFGHALIFSLARLWALERTDVDGILFLARDDRGETRPGATAHVETLLTWLGIECPVITVGAPETVERLVVPAQGVSTAADLFAGTPAWRDFMAARLARIDGAPERPDLYISRTGMAPGKAGLLFEDRLEGYMAAQGYAVFHPQTRSLSDQVASYRAARRIVGVDGSALHLAAMAAGPGTRMAILARRAFFADAFASQARAFGAEATAIDAVRRAHAPAARIAEGSAMFHMLAELDFPAAEGALRAAGFLDAAGGWSDPVPRRLARRVARVGRARGTPYLPVPDATLRHDPAGPPETPPESVDTPDGLT
ncbi:glycosyltransferase family 61 protein [Jannaschia sp. KMU-145]|uniref:glycosyltransferase family 61 protein n=1 Tax=Jannaschia halovivens TaxID=3388667 RepID=UPI00396B0C15